MKKLSKKSRSILSGFFVGLASIYAVVNFLEVPQEEINSFIIATVFFVAGILVLAAFCVVLIKLPGIIISKIKNASSSKDPHSENDSE